MSAPRGVHGDGEYQGRIHPAGEAEYGAAEAVLVHIVAHPEDQGLVDRRLFRRIRRTEGVGGADHGGSAAVVQVEQQGAFPELGGASDGVALPVDHE